METIDDHMTFFKYHLPASRANKRFLAAVAHNFANYYEEYKYIFDHIDITSVARLFDIYGVIASFPTLLFMLCYKSHSLWQYFFSAFGICPSFAHITLIHFSSWLFTLSFYYTYSNLRSVVLVNLSTLPDSLSLLCSAVCSTHREGSKQRRKTTTIISK